MLHLAHRRAPTASSTAKGERGVEISKATRRCPIGGASWSGSHGREANDRCSWRLPRDTGHTRVLRAASHLCNLNHHTRKRESQHDDEIALELLVEHAHGGTRSGASGALHGSGWWGGTMYIPTLLLQQAAPTGVRFSRGGLRFWVGFAFWPKLTYVRTAKVQRCQRNRGPKL